MEQIYWVLEKIAHYHFWKGWKFINFKLKDKRLTHLILDYFNSVELNRNKEKCTIVYHEIQKHWVVENAHNYLMW